MEGNKVENMSKSKTKIDQGLVLDFLKNDFAPDVQTIVPIKDGEISQAFFFSSGGRELVVRFNPRVKGFEKDKLARGRYNSSQIPIPETLRIGQIDNGLQYSITERAGGKLVDQFTKDEIRAFLPAMIECLDAIHAMPIGDTKFGDWDADGVAKFPTWHRFLEKHTEKFQDYLSKPNEGALLEPDVAETILARYQTLLDACPEERKLVHADFGFNNLLSDGQKITGVIDWELAKYGDFLYDVAWLGFFETEIDYPGIFKKHYQEKGVAITNFEERILCYQLKFGLGSLSFYSDSGQERSYTWAKERLLGLL